MSQSPLARDRDAGRPELYEDERWYACYTRSRHEKRVEELLRGRGFASYLPLVARESQWKDRRKTIEWPLFPGYVFGRFTLRDMHDVLTIPGVSTIVRSNGVPTPIADEDVENVRRFAHGLAHTDVEVVARPLLAEGQLVEVMDGPFQGVRGRVVELRGRSRVLVGLAAIRQGLEVDVASAVLRPLRG